MIKKILLLCCFLITPIVSANAVTCNVGEYADGDFCYECPANAECPDGIDFVCDSGWYKNGNICSKCSVENSTCTNGTDYNCLPGFYDDENMCKACPANATCAGGHEFFYCNDGYFKQIRNNGTVVQCLSCANHVCEGETLIRCGDGYYLHGSGMCYHCDAGYYCPPGEAVVGITCDNGYYKNANGTCSKCPTGYYCPRGESSTGADNIRDHCASGYYRTGGSCSKCDDGVICPGGKIDEMVCPDGLYKHDDGRCLNYAPGDCGTAPNCNPGCYNAGNTCTQCSVANSTCTSVDDFKCNAGYYKDVNKCTLCPSNADCSDGTIKCSPGYWLDDNKCTQCGTGGYYCNNNIRYQCPGYSDGIFDPAPPEGHTHLTSNVTTGTAPFSSLITECVLSRPKFASPEGEYVLIASNRYNGTHYVINYSDKYWYAANTGYYLDTAKVYSGTLYYAYSKACTNGAPNSYYTGAGSPGGNDCPWVCEDGYYRNGENCFVCPEGMVCEGGKIICPPGMYVDEASNQCMNCPTGYDDNPNRGAQSINECQMWCDGGYYVPIDGYERCTAVGNGFWREGHFANYKLHDMKYPCRADLTNAGYGAGADEASDCGHELNIGGQKIYMRQDKRTEHALHIKTPAGEIFYSHASPEEIGHVRTLLNGQILSLYDDITAAKEGKPVPEPVTQSE